MKTYILPVFFALSSQAIAMEMMKEWPRQGCQSTRPNVERQHHEQSPESFIRQLLTLQAQIERDFPGHDLDVVIGNFRLRSNNGTVEITQRNDVGEFVPVSTTL